MQKWLLLHPGASPRPPKVSSGEGDYYPLPMGKAPNPTMGLLKPAVLRASVLGFAGSSSDPNLSYPSSSSTLPFLPYSAHSPPQNVLSSVGLQKHTALMLSAN